MKIFNLLTGPSLSMENAHLQTTQGPSIDLLSKLATTTVGNLWRTNSTHHSPKEATDDIVQIGCIIGLPYIIVADGAFGGEAWRVQEVVTNQLPQVLPTYAHRLMQGESALEVMHDLLAAINQLAQTHQAEFVFSLGLTYEYEGRLMLA